MAELVRCTALDPWARARARLQCVLDAPHEGDAHLDTLGCEFEEAAADAIEE